MTDITRIPEDLCWTADDGAHENIQIGRIVRDQSAEIERLRAIPAALRAQELSDAVPAMEMYEYERRGYLKALKDVEDKARVIEQEARKGE